MSIRKTITEYYREAVIGGRYRAGDALPSTSEIAAEFGTQNANVQRALTELVHEGLIVREPRVGTFVRPAQRKLVTAALYMERLFQGLASPYRRYLFEEIERGLGERGIGCRVVVGNASDNGVRQLRRLAESGRIQAVLFIDVCAEIIAQLSSLPVPAIGVTPNPATRHVVLAERHAYPELARAFARHGCRSVGVIGLSSRQLQFSPGTADADANLGLPLLCDAFAKYGIAPDERTLPAPGTTSPCSPAEGVRQLRLLLEAAERPDGLLIASDVLLSALNAAAAEAELRLDRIFKLVAIHRNRQLPAAFPGRALVVEFDLNEVATRLLDMLQNPGGDRRELIYPKLFYQERLTV